VHDLFHAVRFKDSLNATKPQGAMHDLVAVVMEQHDIASRSKQPCSGIVYVHKREDCQSLALTISKVSNIDERAISTLKKPSALIVIILSRLLEFHA
jgi:hypothetical protein